MKISLVKPLLVPFAMTVFFSFLYDYAHSVFLSEHYIKWPLLVKFLQVLLWIFSTFLISRIVILIFERIFYFKTEKKFPNILKDLASFAVWFFSFGVFLSVVLNVDMLKLSTPTSVTIAVLGFSLRGMLMDLFSGIAMGIERPFDVDDWIEIEGYSPGKVKHSNWRVTKIVTRANEELVIPNSYISTKIFKNYTKPDKSFRVTIDITLDLDVTVQKAERMLIGAAHQVESVALMVKKPDAKIKGFSSRGVEWNLRFWIDDYEKKDDIVYQIQKNIVRNMHFGNIEVPPEKHLVTTRVQKDSTSEHNVKSLLGSTDIFIPLSDDEIDLISKMATKILVLAGENAVVAKEDGESLFIVAEGLMSVHIPQNDNKLLHVADIIPGKVFGEMSLLTGAPRSATVKAEVDTIVYEITKENIQQIMLKRPELVTHISNILTLRQMENDQNLKKLSQTDIMNMKNSMSQKFKDTIVSFFKMV